MSKIKNKMIPNISADTVIENDNKMFVTKQHLDVIENSLTPGSVIEQYDDTEVKARLDVVEENTDTVIKGFESLTYSVLQNLMKYDIKEAIPKNLTGYIFVDSLVNASNIESYTNCAYDATNDKIV